MMAGLPGTGKSTLCRALVENSGGIVLDKDAVRATLFAPAHIEYSVEQDDLCQEFMLAAAEYLLAGDRELRVFLDGRPFSREYQREAVRQTAVKMAMPLASIECVCSEATALARLRRDRETGMHPAANRTSELYAEVSNAFEPFLWSRLTINTDQPLAACVQHAEAYLTKVAAAAALL